MKLYFYYGVMGSSKTANALMMKFNFEEKGKNVLLIKPSIDTREKGNLVTSRIGISAKAQLLEPQESILELLAQFPKTEIIIVDEVQFLSSWQIDQLREIADSGIPVFCYGLKTDYMCHLFEGSRRLLEVADTLRELKTMCHCGRKAIINARYQGDQIIYEGSQVDIGGNDKYTALCYQCWKAGKIGNVSNKG
ncbi:MAG: thymidine kinase [Massiliimalia sp.]|jgi:thymidine kinase